MTAAEKEFVISHVFKDVSGMKDDVDHFSLIEDHFGVPWKIGVQRKAGHLGLYLHCLQEEGDKEWSIESWRELAIKGVNGKTFSMIGERAFKSADKYYSWGWEKFINWKDLIKDYVIGDTLRVDIRVKIKKMTGINLRNFDESTKEFSDVVLVVEMQKFYVSKLFLASLSPFFKSTLLEVSESEGLPEHTLKDVKAADFQKFLELLHGESPINESNIERILHLVAMYEATLAIRKCEQFLIENSKKSLKEKLQLSHRYKLEKLKNHCLSKISWPWHIREIVHGNLDEMDPSVVRAVLLKLWDHHAWALSLLITMCVVFFSVLLSVLLSKVSKGA